MNRWDVGGGVGWGGVGWGGMGVVGGCGLVWACDVYGSSCHFQRQ